ncbi:hypothetical protein [Nonomuraea glycinis]|uniref:hypothetical protein n=1 Tax=Nonomuraea glycinis TaxID=2047744 RepID=UPI0033ABFF12
MTGTPLWELPEDDRPCPFAAGKHWLGSWQELRDLADAFDTVLNVVIWWDWYPPDDDTPTDTLRLYAAMPGKERVVPWCAPVTRDQEPEIRAWLQRRLRRLADYWQVGTGPTAETGPVSPAEPATQPPLAAVYIAEAIWYHDNPVDGRDRIAVADSLDTALQAVRGHDIYGGDLVATEITDTPSALGTDAARTWAVHQRGEEPTDEGLLWITHEPLTRPASTDEEGPTG